MSAANDKPIPLKLSQETLDRADAIAEVFAKDPETRALSRISRSSVLRLAILRGLEVLEQEHDIRRKKRPPARQS